MTDRWPPPLLHRPAAGRRRPGAAAAPRRGRVASGLAGSAAPSGRNARAGPRSAGPRPLGPAGPAHHCPLCRRRGRLYRRHWRYPRWFWPATRWAAAIALTLAQRAGGAARPGAAGRRPADARRRGAAGRLVGRLRSRRRLHRRAGLRRRLPDALRRKMRQAILRRPEPRPPSAISWPAAGSTFAPNWPASTCRLWSSPARKIASTPPRFRPTRWPPDCPTAGWRRMDGAGHFGMLERPEEMAALMAGFIGQI